MFFVMVKNTLITRVFFDFMKMFFDKFLYDQNHMIKWNHYKPKYNIKIFAKFFKTNENKNKRVPSSRNYYQPNICKHRIYRNCSNYHLQHLHRINYSHTIKSSDGSSSHCQYRSLHYRSRRTERYSSSSNFQFQ